MNTSNMKVPYIQYTSLYLLHKWDFLMDYNFLRLMGNAILFYLFQFVQLGILYYKLLSKLNSQYLLFT